MTNNVSYTPTYRTYYNIYSPCDFIPSLVLSYCGAEVREVPKINKRNGDDSL